MGRSGYENFSYAWLGNLDTVLFGLPVFGARGKSASEFNVEVKKSFLALEGIALGYSTWQFIQYSDDLAPGSPIYT